jgi:hypothetical protein
MLQEFLHRPTLSRIRRNHALEHATIHLLSARYPRATLVGRSDAGGFHLFADVPMEAVADAAQEALARLSHGQHQLAIHPNCGTSFLTAGVLGGGAAFLSLAGRSAQRGRLRRLPLAVVATLIGLLIAQPLGLALQRSITTQADPEGLRLIEVKTWRRGHTTFHRIVTAG